MRQLDSGAESVVADALGAVGYRGVWVHTMSQPDGTVIVVVSEKPIESAEIVGGRQIRQTESAQ